MKVKYRLVFDRKKLLITKGVGLVQIQAYLDGDRKYFSTKLYLKENEWDRKRTTAKDPYVAKSLRELIAKFENFEVQHRALNRKFSLADFDQLTCPKIDKKKITFTEFFRQQLTKETQLEHSTLTTQKNTFNVLCKFQQVVELTDLNYEFLQDFENYLRAERNLAVNTIDKYHRHLRKYINLAIKKELLTDDKNPYKNYKLVTEETEAIFLTIEETQRIELLTFADDEKEMETVRDMFLFSCYTGLRFSDVYSLNGDDFQQTKEELVLKFKSQKTKKTGYQPLHILFDGKPQAIAQKYFKPKTKDLLFKGLYNPKVNRVLKIIAERAKVNRGLYFKASRDTFGTTLYLISGDQKLVQTQLQHSKAEQTNKYVRTVEQIQNERLKKAFNKWSETTND